MAERRLAMLAGGGHARVLIDALECSGAHVSVILDPAIGVGQRVFGVPVVGDEGWLSSVSVTDFVLVNGVGSQPRSRLRKNIFERAVQSGFSFATVIHPSTIISRQVELLQGAQVMAGAIVQCSTRIGVNTIINTGARVDHDCEIADHSFVGPGAIICGGVRVGMHSYIGAGAVILPGIVIGTDAVVGAGAIVTRDVDAGTLVIGNPAIQKGQP